MVRIEPAAVLATAGPGPALGKAPSWVAWVGAGTPVPDFRHFAYLGTFQNVLGSLLDVLPTGHAPTPRQSAEREAELPLPAVTPRTPAEERAQRAASEAAPATAGTRADSQESKRPAAPAVTTAEVAEQTVVDPTLVAVVAVTAPQPLVVAPSPSVEVAVPQQEATKPVSAPEPATPPALVAGPDRSRPTPETPSATPAATDAKAPAPLAPKPHADPSAAPGQFRFAPNEGDSEQGSHPSGLLPRSSPTAPQASPAPPPQAEAVSSRPERAAPDTPLFGPKPDVEPPSVQPRPHAVVDRILGLDVEEILQSMSASGRDAAAREAAATTPAVPPPMAALLVAAPVAAEAAPALPASRSAVHAAAPTPPADAAASRAGRIATPPTAPGSDAAERVEFIEKIVRAARAARSSSGASLRLVLHPPRLGHMKVDLAVRDHVLHGRLAAETEGARDLVRAHLGMLREALEQQGIRVGTLEVAWTVPSAGSPRPESAERPGLRSGGDRSRERREERADGIDTVRGARVPRARRPALVDVLA